MHSWEEKYQQSCRGQQKLLGIFNVIIFWCCLCVQVALSAKTNGCGRETGKAKNLTKLCLLSCLLSSSHSLLVFTLIIMAGHVHSM